MEVTQFVVGFALAVVIVGGGALDLAGVRTPIGPPESSGTAGAWANVLIGTGLALATAARMPSGHRLFWDGVLLGPAVMCVIVAAVLYARPRKATR